MNDGVLNRSIHVIMNIDCGRITVARANYMTTTIMRIQMVVIRMPMLTTRKY